MSEWKTCACGARIRWGISPTGARMPLVPLKGAYVVDRTTPEGDPVLKSAGAEVYLNHFVDCPKRDEFRRSR